MPEGRAGRAPAPKANEAGVVVFEHLGHRMASGKTGGPMQYQSRSAIGCQPGAPEGAGAGSARGWRRDVQPVG